MTATDSEIIDAIGKIITMVAAKRAVQMIHKLLLNPTKETAEFMVDHASIIFSQSMK